MLFQLQRWYVYTRYTKRERKIDRMISYNPLWHTLINNGMNKGDLMEKTGISYGTMASMGKNEPVNLKQIDRICKALNCGISDVIEYIPD